VEVGPKQQPVGDVVGPFPSVRVDVRGLQNVDVPVGDKLQTLDVNRYGPNGSGPVDCSHGFKPSCGIENMPPKGVARMAGRRPAAQSSAKRRPAAACW
jgi:hypothetical protein